MARKKIMPEVPDQQAPSKEEVKLTNEPLPQPSEAELDKQVVEQKPADVVPVEPEEGNSSDNSPYKEGDAFSFSAPSGESYSILVTKVEGDQVTLQNSAPDSAAITLPLEEARKILESDARTR